MSSKCLQSDIRTSCTKCCFFFLQRSVDGSWLGLLCMDPLQCSVQRWSLCSVDDCAGSLGSSYRHPLPEDVAVLVGGFT